MTKICTTDIKAPQSTRRRRANVRGALRFFIFVVSAYTFPLASADFFSGVTRSEAQTPADNTRESEVYTVTGDGSTLKEIDDEMVLEFPNGVRIEHEDVIATARRGIHYDRRMLTYLIGDVKIIQGTMTMWGDEGEYQRLEDLAVMHGNVRIVDEGWEVTCDEARYYRSTGRGWLLGNIVAKDSASTLYADSLYYDREESMTEVFGNLRITNPDEGFAAEGEHGYYYRGTGEGVIDRKPHLIVDPDSPEPVTIDSDTMRVYPDQSHAVAYYTVKILKGTTVTQCDSAVLYDNENRAELYGNPLAKQDRVSMKGEMMALHYDEDEVHQIDINGGAETVSTLSECSTMRPASITPQPPKKRRATS
jgi:lipopolysaccharide export system protein LptA